MVQGGRGGLSTNYRGGIDAFRTILRLDGLRGLYRGFTLSVFTCAPSNALWWASYCVFQRSLWTTLCNQRDNFEPSSAILVGVQGLSASLASGVSTVLTTPLDTLKTRFQVLKDDNSGKRPTLRHTLRMLVVQGGYMAFYRGIGPRWASMSMSATTMIITYEFLKRMSTKTEQMCTQRLLFEEPHSILHPALRYARLSGFRSEAECSRGEVTFYEIVLYD